MKRLWYFALGSILAACSGGGSSAPATLPQQGSFTQITDGMREAQSDAIYLPQATPVPVSSDLLYVGNAGNNSITVYPHDAQGDTAPLFVISGSRTAITHPQQLSEDAQGNLYVADATSVLIFAHGTKGNVAPIRVIAGPQTGIVNVSAVTVDQMTGKIFVVAKSPNDGTPANLLRFAPDASGNVAPFAIGVIDRSAVQLANDSTGNNLIESGIASCCSSDNGETETFVKQFANRTTPVVRYGIGIWATQGVADDPTTKTFLETYPQRSYYDSSGVLTYTTNQGIYRFAENTTGQGYPAQVDSGTAHFTPDPVSVISSATSCGQLALGYLRNIYAVCGSAIHVYAHDSSGNAAPLRILSGPATKLNQPSGIYEGK